MQLSHKQKEACQHIASNKFIGICWWKPGEGKTRIALALAEMSGAVEVVIVCQKKAMQGWRDEIAEVGFAMSFHIFSADGLHKFPHAPEGSAYDESFLIIDELYYFANHTSGRSKLLRKVAMNFPYRVGLSGTIQPAGCNSTIWGQCYALLIETRLANTFTEFRTLYQNSMLSHFTVKKKGRIQTFVNKPESVEKICSILADCTHTYFPSNEHRQIRHKIVNIQFDQAQITAIQQVKKEFQLILADKGVDLDYKTSMEVMTATNRISNGWIANNAGQIQQISSTKLDALSAILETLHSAGQKAVIWCAYRGDIEFLEKALPYRTVHYWGGEDFRYRDWQSGKFDFVLATVASGASVNYFGNVEYAIYFSLPLKLVDFIQSKGRHERKSSSHAGAFYYYLLGTGHSFDHHIFNLLDNNNEAEQTIIRQLAKQFLL